MRFCCIRHRSVMMNFSASVHRRSPASKENVPPSGKADALQLQRPRMRTVLGVLSENESQSRTHSQGSHFSSHSSMSDSSQPTSSGLDIYVEEVPEVVLSAAGEEVASGSSCQDAALLDDDTRLVLEMSSSLCPDASLPFLLDESMMSEKVLCVYAEDIHRHMRERELRFRSRPGYEQRHPELTDSMRLLLVDWLAESFQEYLLSPETLYLTVNYVDRFLSRTVRMKPGKLHVFGAAALMVATKQEEVWPPSLDDMVHAAGGIFTKRQLVKMEKILLNVLDFNIAAPTIDFFLRIYMAVQPLCLYTGKLAMYVAELSLLDINPFLQYTPSIVAAAAYCLADYTVSQSLWPHSLHTFTGYTMADIHPCLTDLHKLHANADSRPEQAIREKYKGSKYCYVSYGTPLAALPAAHDSRPHPSSDASGST